MVIHFVTSNENKLKEVESILGKKLNRESVEIDEIQEIELDRIIKDKARKAYEQLQKPVLVEDTAFHIKAWNNFPGALIKWTLESLGNKGICKLLINEKNRDVTVRTLFCLYDGQNFEVFEGKLDGKIPNEPRGDTNFGWDPIFIPQGYEKTFAEMSREQKNEISMRSIALKELKKFLDNSLI